MRRRLMLNACLLALAAGPATGATVLPDFSAASFIAGAPIDNLYHPLLQGQTSALTATGEDDGEPFTERTERTVLGPGREILGVQTTTLLDRAYEDDVLVEETYDYFAQDTAGNVWYMGEDVTNYRYDDDGNFLGTDSASTWLAGENGALPGFIMPADPQPGFAYYQEYAVADEALDQGLIFDVIDSLTTGAGTFLDVLVVFETTELEPNARELKYYAPGIGIIRAEEGVDADFANAELVFDLVPAPVPVPASLPLTVLAMSGLAGIRRLRG